MDNLKCDISGIPYDEDAYGILYNSDKSVRNNVDRFVILDDDCAAKSFRKIVSIKNEELAITCVNTLMSRNIIARYKIEQRRGVGENYNETYVIYVERNLGKKTYATALDIIYSLV